MCRIGRVHWKTAVSPPRTRFSVRPVGCSQPVAYRSHRSRSGRRRRLAIGRGLPINGARNRAEFETTQATKSASNSSTEARDITYSNTNQNPTN